MVYGEKLVYDPFSIFRLRSFDVINDVITELSPRKPACVSCCRQIHLVKVFGEPTVPLTSSASFIESSANWGYLQSSAGIQVMHCTLYSQNCFVRTHTRASSVTRKKKVIQCDRVDSKK